MRENRKLTSAQRRKLPARAFACPERRSFPIQDAAHVRNALGRWGQKTEHCRGGLARICGAARRFDIDSEVCQKKGLSINPVARWDPTMSLESWWNQKASEEGEEYKEDVLRGAGLHPRDIETYATEDWAWSDLPFDVRRHVYDFMLMTQDNPRRKYTWRDFRRGDFIETPESKIQGIMGLVTDVFPPDSVFPEGEIEVEPTDMAGVIISEPWEMPIPVSPRDVDYIYPRDNPRSLGSPLTHYLSVREERTRNGEYIFDLQKGWAFKGDVRRWCEDYKYEAPGGRKYDTIKAECETPAKYVVKDPVDGKDILPLPWAGVHYTPPEGVEVLVPTMPWEAGAKGRTRREAHVSRYSQVPQGATPAEACVLMKAKFLDSDEESVPAGAVARLVYNLTHESESGEPPLIAKAVYPHGEEDVCFGNGHPYGVIELTPREIPQTKDAWKELKEKVQRKYAFGRSGGAVITIPYEGILDKMTMYAWY